MARKEAGAPLERGATPWIAAATLIGQVVLIPAVRADQAQSAGRPAAAAESGALDEIVVTAQRRSENIQAIGLSIAALSAEDVDSMNVSGAKEMVNHVSGVLVNDNFGTYTSYVIRGIGQNDFEANSSPSAAVYVDDIYQANTIAGSPLVFDLERVEILKGPQGTLYGRNSSSGAVNMISKRPTSEFEASAKVLAARFERYELEAAISGPFNERLMYRLAGKVLRQDSPYDLATPEPARPVASGEAYAPKDQAFRGQLLWKPADTTEVLLMGKFAQQKGIASNSIAIPTTQTPGGPVCLGRNAPPDARAGCRAGYAAGGFVVPPTDKFTVSVNFLEPMDNTFRGVSARVDHDFSAATLTSISAYEDFDFFRNWDEDATVINGLHIREGIEFDQLSQELRLAGVQGRLDWIVGAFYSDDSYHDIRNLYAGQFVDGLGTVNYVGAPGRVGSASPRFAARVATANGLLSDLTQETTSAALFTDDKIRLTERLSLVGGYRFTYEKRRFFGTGSVVFTDGSTELANQNDVGPAIGDEAIETRRSSGRLGLNWQLDPRKLVYGLVSGAFKSGGFDGSPSSNVAVTFTPYREEVVNSAELGFKTDWSNLRLNGAIFYTRYDDPQARIRFDVLGADGVTIIPQTQLGNLDKAIAKGAELELSWRIIDGLKLDATGTYLDTTISTSGSAAATFNGNPLPFAPKFSGTLGIEYAWSIGAGLVAGIGVDGKYVGTHYLRPEKFAIDEEQYTVVNAQARLGGESGRWEVELFGKNIGDEQYRVNAVGGIGADVFAIGQPTIWGLAARIRM
jgi:iron complex outermembrane receptor protein